MQHYKAPQPADILVSDALGLERISIDEDVYQLSNTTKAFGVRVDYVGSSRANPISNQTLSLFVPSNNTLKKVLDNFEITTDRGVWDTMCDGEFFNNKKDLIISEDHTNGFFDINVIERITETTTFEDQNGDCEEKTFNSIKKQLLTYNGDLYSLSNVVTQHKKPLDFIPKGYVLYEKHYGDLNHDGQDDCVLIIKGTAKEKIVVDNYEKTVDRNRRGIIILFKYENNYQLVDKNYDCFSSEHEDGGGYYPPQLWIEFENNNLKLLYRHGKYGNWSYLFKYQNSNFEMIRFEETQSNGSRVLKETRIDFLTKQKWVRKNTSTDTETNDEVFEETQSPIKIETLIKLSEIKDFDEYPVLTRFTN